MALFDVAMFDLDGTLVDSLPDIAAALNQTLLGAGRPALPRALIAAYVGDGAARLVQRALPEATPASTLAALVDDFRTHYARNLCVETRPYPGIEGVLQRLAAAIPLAVLTNKPAELARPLLQQLGLDRYFVRIIGDGDGFARKPAPDAGRWLIQHHAGGAARALVVGDGLPDIRFAHALGASSAAATWGYVTRDLLTAENPTWLIDDPAELIPLALGAP